MFRGLVRGIFMLVGIALVILGYVVFLGGVGGGLQAREGKTVLAGWGYTDGGARFWLRLGCLQTRRW